MGFPTTQQVRLIVKPIWFTACLLPFTSLLLDAVVDNARALGADPIEAIHDRTGIWGLRFLLLTLAVPTLFWPTIAATGLEFRPALTVALLLMAGLLAAVAATEMGSMWAAALATLVVYLLSALIPGFEYFALGVASFVVVQFIRLPSKPIVALDAT